MSPATISYLLNQFKSTYPKQYLFMGYNRMNDGEVWKEFESKKIIKKGNAPDCSKLFFWQIPFYDIRPLLFVSFV